MLSTAIIQGLPRANNSSSFASPAPILLTFRSGLTYNTQKGVRFEAVCLECDPCSTCEVENGEIKPECTRQLEHTNSSGGTNVTLETLLIDPGYWRATNVSESILECYYKDACEGGLTDDPNFCHKGYTGPCM